MSNRKYLFIIIFLIIALIASVFVTLKTTVFFGKAATFDSNQVILENSYLFASPIQAKADDKEKIRITAFLLDNRGLGVSNKLVELETTNAPLSIQDIQAVSDETGRAIFDISSLSPGKYNISASVDNKTLPQQIKILFY